jgi:uncharacterized membrane protein YeiH
MLDTIPVFLYIMDLLGTFVFAITGGFRAIKYEMDIFGVFSLATAVGVGGGMIRDVLLGSVPSAALRSSVYLLTTCAAGGCVFLFAPRIAPTWRKILYADAVGLGLFAAIGAAKAYLAGLGPVGIMFIATIASVGGSFIRDVCTGELPLISTKDIYASAAMFGGLIYWAVETVCPGRHISFGAAFAVTVIVRMAALRWNINLPRSQRLPASPSQIARGIAINPEDRENDSDKGTVSGNE